MTQAGGTARAQVRTLARTIETGAKRAVYSANQMARMAWYTGHYVAGRRKMGPVTNPGEAPAASAFSPIDRSRLGASYRALLRADWKNVRDGVYKLPADFRDAPNPGALWRQSRDYLRDTEAVARRKHEHAHSEVMTEKTSKDYPRYYLQNFHYQTDGWLTESSAARYDMQVETLFTGAAAAMRRQTLPFIAEAIGAGARGAGVRYLDLACGTGCFTREVLHNWPNLDATVLDLSTAYLNRARTALADYPETEYRRVPAEETGFADASFDIVTAVYLFHELPPKVRRLVATEISRILKPGGLFVLTDTLQYGDEPGLDALLEAFPRSFHEPYYDTFCREDLSALFAEVGLQKTDETIGFLTKATAFKKQ
ncbi:MAG: class I SAM-dependent methyltransferase [Pseudomonadota bacterium]